MHKIVTLFIIIFLIIPYLIHAEKIYSSKEDITNSETISPLTTIRQSLGKVVVIPESDPFFGIIGAGIACCYSTDTDTAGLLPLLVQKEGNLTFRQDLFLSQYLKGENNTLIILGEHLDTIYKTTEFFGSPPEQRYLRRLQRFL